MYQLHIYKSKNALFKNNSLLDSSVKKNEKARQPCRPQPVRYPLPFKIALRKLILMYMILSGEGDLTGSGLRGCSLVSVLF